MKVLVVEDEPQVSAMIMQGLEEQSVQVDVAYDGNMAQRLGLSRHYDAVLLDLVIPGINGFELCKILKKEKPMMPIIMLTTLGTTGDKMSGFDAGTDDYLLKPFEFKELIARLNALVRGSANSGSEYNNILRFEDLRLDMERKVAKRQDKIMKLSAKEFNLLKYFMENPGRVISRQELTEKIWNIKFETNTNVVEVYMNMLRNKIDRGFEPKLLQTRFGHGYVLSCE